MLSLCQLLFCKFDNVIVFPKWDPDDRQTRKWDVPSRITIAGLTLESFQGQSEIDSESNVSNLTEGIQTFKELEEEERVGKVYVGPYMYKPDGQDAENVEPERPDMEWTRDPSGLEER